MNLQKKCLLSEIQTFIKSRRSLNSNLRSGRILASLLSSLLLVARSLAKIGPDTISHRTVSAAKLWPREPRNLIGPLKIELSTEVNCLRDSLTISIRPPSPRNKSARSMCRSKIFLLF